MKALTHVHLYDYDRFLPDAYILFDSRIHQVGPMTEFSPGEAEIIDGEGRWILPGLINFHTHIYSMLFRGLDLGAHPATFQDILDMVWWRFDRHLDLEALTHSAALYSDESLLFGVTALIDHHASGTITGSLDAIRQGLKIPALLCFETSDRFDIDASLGENTDRYLGLHASLSLSDATLDRASKIVKPIHIHVAESLEDETDAWSRYDRSVVQRLKKHGLLREDSILAHCVNIDAAEARLIGESGAYISIQPTSNLNNAVGLFPYHLFREHGIPLLVGTDGLGADIGRAWQNLYYVGKQSLSQPDGINLGEVLHHLRLSYDYFSRMSGRPVGRLEKGYSADFAAFDYTPPTPVHDRNIFGHVFYGLFGRFRPESVYVEGQRKVASYRLTAPTPPDHGLVHSLWNRILGE